MLTQQLAKELAAYDQLILLCGHYEGVDERAIEAVVDLEISIGDYVLTGGEIPAMALIDCVARMVDGVLPNSDAYSNDSHYNGLLEHPQYTRPPEFRGRAVPEILLSGHHANIEAWRGNSRSTVPGKNVRTCSGVGFRGSGQSISCFI